MFRLLVVMTEIVWVAELNGVCMCVCSQLYITYHSSVRVADVSVSNLLVNKEPVVGAPQMAYWNAVPEDCFQAEHRDFPVSRKRQRCQVQLHHTDLFRRM